MNTKPLTVETAVDVLVENEVVVVVHVPLFKQGVVWVVHVPLELGGFEQGAVWDTCWPAVTEYQGAANASIATRSRIAETTIRFLKVAFEATYEV